MGTGAIGTAPDRRISGMNGETGWMARSVVGRGCGDIADGSLSAVKLLIGLGIALAGILLAFRKYSEKDLN